MRFAPLSLVLVASFLFTIEVSAQGNFSGAGQRNISPASVNNDFGFENGKLNLDIYARFRQLLDSSIYEGFSKHNYNYRELFSSPPGEQRDTTWRELYKKAVAKYCRNIYKGTGVNGLLRYNGIKDVTDSIEFKLAAVRSGDELEKLVSELEPSLEPFAAMKKALRTSIFRKETQNLKLLTHTLNTLRWISHFGFSKCIVVNIASATLSYYQHDSLPLSMKLVVGKPSTQTPRFAAYCNEIILYPYWHVPRSIAVNELLPLAKRRPGILSAMNLDVIDSRGQVISSGKINWHKYSKYNFPYQFRQSTGCGNALGVIKFNLTSPYSVYLHDTNMKNAFTSNERYFSHGCIRIEKPIELANYLLPGKIDSNFLKACIRNQRPVNYALQRPVPIFVIYLRAWVDTANSTKYYRDIYHLKDAE